MFHLFSSKEERKPAKVNFQDLFRYMQADLDMGICCDIHFTCADGSHTLGCYGDDGETKENVKYYLDKPEYDSLTELKAKAQICGVAAAVFQEPVTVVEADGGYPRLDREMAKYIVE